MESGPGDGGWGGQERNNGAFQHFCPERAVTTYAPFSPGPEARQFRFFQYVSGAFGIPHPVLEVIVSEFVSE